MDRLGRSRSLSSITFPPLVGAIVIAILPRHGSRPIRYTALVTALVAWSLSLLLLVAVRPEPAGLPVRRDRRLDPAFGIQYKLGVDGLSVGPRRPDHDPHVDQHPGPFRPIQDG